MSDSTQQSAVSGIWKTMLRVNLFTRPSVRIDHLNSKSTSEKLLFSLRLGIPLKHMKWSLCDKTPWGNCFLEVLLLHYYRLWACSAILVVHGRNCASCSIHRYLESQNEILVHFTTERHKSPHCSVLYRKKCQWKEEVYIPFSRGYAGLGYDENVLFPKRKNY